MTRVDLQFRKSPVFHLESLLPGLFLDNENQHLHEAIAALVAGDPGIYQKRLRRENALRLYSQPPQ